jgi:hypothetical protein
MKLGRFIVLIHFYLCFTLLKGQCDTLPPACATLLNDFVSDGQLHRALLLNTGEYAEFRQIFFGGNLYRLGVCNGSGQSVLVFRVYDRDRHLLFTNHDHMYKTFWDFKVKFTQEVTIEVELREGSVDKSACVMLMIGFKAPSLKKP